MFPGEEKGGGDKTEPEVVERRKDEEEQQEEEEGAVQPGSDYIICSTGFETELTQEQKKKLHLNAAY